MRIALIDSKEYRVRFADVEYPDMLNEVCRFMRIHSANLRLFESDPRMLKSNDAAKLNVDTTFRPVIFTGTQRFLDISSAKMLDAQHAHVTGDELDRDPTDGTMACMFFKDKLFFGPVVIAGAVDNSTRLPTSLPDGFDHRSLSKVCARGVVRSLQPSTTPGTDYMSAVEFEMPEFGLYA